MDAQVTVVAEDVQVAAKPRRRTYTAEYKRRILKEALLSIPSPSTPS